MEYKNPLKKSQSQPRQYNKQSKELCLSIEAEQSWTIKQIHAGATDTPHCSTPTSFSGIKLSPMYIDVNRHYPTHFPSTLGHSEFQSK